MSTLHVVYHGISARRLAGWLLVGDITNQAEEKPSLMDCEPGTLHIVKPAGLLVTDERHAILDALASAIEEDMSIPGEEQEYAYVAVFGAEEKYLDFEEGTLHTEALSWKDLLRFYRFRITPAMRQQVLMMLTDSVPDPVRFFEKEFPGKYWGVRNLEVATGEMDLFYALTEVPDFMLPGEFFESFATRIVSK